MHVKKMSSEEDTSQRAGSQEDPVFKSDYTKTTKLIFTKPVGGKSSSDLDEQGSLLQLQSSRDAPAATAQTVYRNHKHDLSLTRPQPYDQNQIHSNGLYP